MIERSNRDVEVYDRDWEELLGIFIKTLMGNSLSIAWLFVFKFGLELAWFRIAFWSLYFVITVFVPPLVWFCFRKTRGYTKHGNVDVQTPVFAAVAATFQPLVFTGVWFAYQRFPNCMSFLWN